MCIYRHGLPFTNNQVRFIRLLVDGLTNPMISGKLKLHPSKVKRELSKIYRVIGLAGYEQRTQAAVWWLTGWKRG